MTGRAVVPTLAAPAAENQPLGQFQGASSESRVTITSGVQQRLRRTFNRLAWGRIAAASDPPHGRHRSMTYAVWIGNDFAADCAL
jgi:hypothetical protein